MLSDLVRERVVDQLDPEDLAQRNMPKVDPKTLKLFRVLAREITCGRLLKESEVGPWFSKFSSFKKGSLTNKEFLSAVESLDAHLVFSDKFEQFG